MTVAEARTAVRASTFHDTDTQVTDAQLDVKLNQEYRRLRRQLAAYVPTLFEAQVLAVVTAPAFAFLVPGNYEKVRLLERLISGTLFYPVPLLDRLNANQASTLNFYEQIDTLGGGSTLVLQPTQAAPGTYRLTYQTNPGSIYTVYDVPGGLEDVFIERTAAWVRQRHDEDPGYHLAVAERIWRDQKSALKRRYGVHPVPGLMRTR